MTFSQAAAPLLVAAVVAAVLVWGTLSPRRRLPFLLLGIAAALGVAGYGPWIVLFPLLWLFFWPVPAVAAGVTGVFAVVSGQREGRGAELTTWLRLCLTWLWALVAVYGYGISGSSIVRGTSPSCASGDSGRSVSFLPLHDVACGNDSVPGWVDLALFTFLLLLAVSAVGAIRAGTVRNR
ncbi:hypothetical protein ACSNOI_36040 [Actinomadura kijaniata]|uniref:hypothetical protein n=1 Tax=Actinomadura kijaniata TaxID=46161 RepID=UPI003F1D8611